jgi:hypothetical protein
MHVFSRDVRDVFSELSKSLYNAITVKQRLMNPLLTVLNKSEFSTLYEFSNHACKSHTMCNVMISNSVCRLNASARVDYFRASLNLASWKSYINFEMIVAQRTVYFNINSDFTRVQCTLRLVTGLVIMMWKNNLVKNKEIRILNLVICSSTPLLHIHKMHIHSICRLLTQFLRKRFSEEEREVVVQLLNCI